jgi:L-methionine (R)-S-oxide reductase
MDDSNRAIRHWLAAFIERNHGVAGSVHLREGDELILVAAHNLPPKVQEVTARIPRGKGMAGLAFERQVPIQTCNLQSDASGAVRPGARAVDANAAIAMPVTDAAGEVRAVVGIAFVGEREIAGEELERLMRGASELPA